MPRIALKNLTPGMQLSRAVVNEAGAKLVNPGTRITQAMLGRLVNANIRYVYVVNQAGDGALDEALLALEARFVKTRDKPHMDRLKRLLQEHFRELYS